MKEALENAREELKRVDHLIYVSLKYTRTVDVIKSIIDRLINSLEFSIDSLTKLALEKGMIASVPSNLGLKCNAIRKKFSDQQIDEMVQFFVYLRKLNKADYRRSNEFRRHVTMTAIVDGQVLNITMDVIKEYYEKTRAYIDHAAELVGTGA